MHPDFLSTIQPGNTILDVGCGPGRISRLLGKKCKVVGIDINEKEIEFARSQGITNAEFMVASGADLSQFSSNSFDGAVLVGTLGGVHKELRDLILAETARVIRPRSPIYVAELTRKHGNAEREAIYKRDAEMTGEMGSRVVYEFPGERGKILYIAKHFEPEELVELLQTHGLTNIQFRKHIIVKEGIVDLGQELREEVSVWGYK